jgi:shikimate kinase
MIVMLMGLRGAGKSTIGQLLAQRLDCRCVDLDQLTLAAMGSLNVADAWRAHGEAAFRETESQALRDALDIEQDLILSLGGGTPTAPGAADAMRRAVAVGSAFVVYLRADARTLGSRIASGDADRPSLTGADPVEEMQSVLESRDELYRELADIEIDATLDAGRIVDQIAASVEAGRARRGSGRD